MGNLSYIAVEFVHRKAKNILIDLEPDYIVKIPAVFVIKIPSESGSSFQAILNVRFKSRNGNL